MAKDMGRASMEAKCEGRAPFYSRLTVLCCLMGQFPWGLLHFLFFPWVALKVSTEGFWSPCYSTHTLLCGWSNGDELPLHGNEIGAAP